ncbi:hypothetical protein ACFWYW_25055 [Nonomuraea sp. NPDC059023]|uniref:hypothetical protein n=1 Tax=unclassified Nonomuraea TaxID=2593643 RepID=UPI003696B84E
MRLWKVDGLPSRMDELAERRLVKLVVQVKAMMAANLKPEYGGFYGQLLLAPDAVAELGELAEVPKAARAPAGLTFPGRPDDEPGQGL